MKLSHYIYILFFIIFLSCTQRNAINRNIHSPDPFAAKFGNEDCILIINRNFDASCEEIKQDKLNSILKNSIFINKENKDNDKQLSKYLVFKIAIENTGTVPFEAGELKLQAADMALKPLTAEDLMNSNTRSAISFRELLSLHRLNVDDICENDIDFKRDIIENPASHINPGEKVFFFAVFNWLPVQVRKFNLLIEIKSENDQKIIDFKLIRFENRQFGKDFIKSKKDDNY